MTKYNQSIRDVFGVGRVAGEVGIEIEMEGRGFIPGPIAPYWHHHRDHSLRGEENAEYVLAQPISRKEVPGALGNLFKALKQTGTRIRKDSPNTSVHVHLNMQEWSVKKTYNLICLWYIFEQTLVDWCGEERVGNVFCLRGGDAEVSLMRLASAIRYGRMNTIADQEGLRYSALNYTALAKFGSLEFRSLAGVYDEDVINTWVRVLLALKDYAEKFVCPSDIIVEMSRLGHEEFFRAVFGDLASIVRHKDTTAQMQQGMRLIQGVAYCVNWDRDTEVKKKEVGQPEHYEGVFWHGIFVTVDNLFPRFRDGDGVDEYIRLRDRHNLEYRRNQQRRLVPPHPLLNGNVWYVNDEGRFQEVHPDNLVRMEHQGWHRYQDGEGVVPEQAVAEPPRERPVGPEDQFFADRNGFGQYLRPGEAVEMRGEDGVSHIVSRPNVSRRIVQGWVF